MEQGVTRIIGIATLCSVLGIILGGTAVYYTTRSPSSSSPIVVSTPLPTPTGHPSPTPRPIRVYVSGAVVRPAVCRLPAGSIVEDVLAAAGGPTAEADLSCINLALELQDQQHVHVPAKGEADVLPVISGGVSERAIGVLLNINTATAAELETLPGVGEVMAERIVAFREANGPFEATEDIQNVSGIGPKTFEGMRDAITVD